MYKVVMALGISVCATGCSLDPATLVPVAPGQLSSAITRTNTLEQEILTALNREDDVLIYLTRGRYRCGDLKNEQLKRRINLRDEDIAKFVTDRKQSEAWAASLNFIEAYAGQLKEIADNTASTAGKASYLTQAAKVAVKFVPGIPGTTEAAALAFEKAVQGVINLRGIALMAKAAAEMEKPLRVAVDRVAKYYPEFLSNERLAFKFWDECAREKLGFIRDNPLNRIQKFPPDFAVSNANELEAAYLAYIAQRAKFKAVPPVAQILKAIVDENKRLTNPDLSYDDLKAIAANAKALFDSGKAAIDAARSLQEQVLASQSVASAGSRR